MSLLRKYSDFIKKISSSQGKNINKIFTYLLIGIIILLSSSFFLSNPKKEKNEGLHINTAENMSDTIYKEETKAILERQLKEILTHINGAGKVEVMLTLQSTEEIEPAYNIQETKKTTEEEDTQGGIRYVTELITSKQVVVIREQSGHEKPVVIRKISPQIEGVIIIAEGADNSIVKEMLTNAAETVLNIPAYKIKVLPMK